MNLVFRCMRWSEHNLLESPLFQRRTRPIAFSVAILVIVQVSLLIPDATAAGWQVETVDVGSVGMFDSLAIDSSGRPHISYYDDNNGNLKYATKVGTTWVPEVVTLAGRPHGASNAVYTSIAVDLPGKPHIVFFDDKTNQLKYAVKSGATWTIEVADTGCGSPCVLNYIGAALGNLDERPRRARSSPCPDGRLHPLGRSEPSVLTPIEAGVLSA